MSKEEKRIKQRLKTILSKLMELQDIERNSEADILPSSTEGFMQDITPLALDI